MSDLSGRTQFCPRCVEHAGTLARVRAAHPLVDDELGPHCGNDDCGNAGLVTWPCPTIRLLDDR